MIHLSLNFKDQTISNIWNESELNHLAERWCVEPSVLYRAILETGSNDVRYLYQYLKTRGEIVHSKKIIRQITNFVALYR